MAFDIVGKPPDNPESLSVVVQVSDSSAIQRRAATTISVTIGHPPPLAGVFGGDGIVSAGGDAAQLVFSVFGGALMARRAAGNINFRQLPCMARRLWKLAAKTAMVNDNDACGV